MSNQGPFSVTLEVPLTWDDRRWQLGDAIRNWRTITRDWPTVDQAIRSAKSLHRTHRSPVDIALEGEVLAVVTSDAYGRVWVDAKIYGNTLI